MEYWLNVSFTLKQRDAVGAARATRSRGTSSRCRVSKPKARTPSPRRRNSTVKDGEGEATISGKTFSVRFDKQAGLMTQLQVPGRDGAGARSGARLLARAHQQRSRRVEVDRDARRRRIRRRISSVWRDAGPRWVVKDVRVETVNDSTARVW